MSYGTLLKLIEKQTPPPSVRMGSHGPKPPMLARALQEAEVRLFFARWRTLIGVYLQEGYKPDLYLQEGVTDAKVQRALAFDMWGPDDVGLHLLTHPHNDAWVSFQAEMRRYGLECDLVYAEGVAPIRFDLVMRVIENDWTAA